MDFTTASLNYHHVENIPKEARRSLVRDTLSLCLIKELKQIFPSEKLAWMAYLKDYVHVRLLTESGSVWTFGGTHFTMVPSMSSIASVVRVLGA